MQSMLAGALKSIEKYHMLNKYDRVVVGLSGGADSVCLLYLLLELRERYSLYVAAAHVNHGLRGSESDGDESFVRELCKRLGVDLTVFQFDLNAESKQMKIGVEEAGRLLRYQSFDNAAEGFRANKIAVAHNRNDSVETVLMRLIRGTGLKGMAGIPPVRGNIIRPLIETGRDEIEEYCKLRNISFRTDSTNFEDVYTRNKIRLELLPAMLELNPDALGAISRMTRLIADEDELLESLTHAENCLSETGSIIIGKMQGLPLPLMRRTVRRAFGEYTNHLRDISFEHVEMVLSLLNKDSGKRVRLPGLYAERRYGEIFFGSEYEAAKTGFRYPVLLDTPTEIPEAGLRVMASENPPDEVRGILKIFDSSTLNGGLAVRTRMPGDKIFVPAMGGTKKLKDYFIDIKLPRAERDNIALLVCGEDVLWIMDEKNIVSGMHESGSGCVHKLYIQKWEE